MTPYQLERAKKELGTGMGALLDFNRQQAIGTALGVILQHLAEEKADANIRKSRG